MERFDRIDRTLERMNKLKECLEGDTLLDNYDLCQLLGLTKRTLARYRQKKYVTYYMIDGRTYYKASEVEAFLNQKGKVLPPKLKNRMDVQLKRRFRCTVTRVSCLTHASSTRFSSKPKTYINYWNRITTT